MHLPSSRALMAASFLFFCTFLGAADYYWVGGSGNWSDLSHWATTSGGSTRHNQIPTAKDRVFFDARSFTGPAQTVSTDVAVYCLDMDWTGATGTPRFSAPAGATLYLFGSLVLNPAMSFDFLGDVVFSANTSGHRIDPAGLLMPRNVRFSGNGGGWTLSSALRVDSMLVFETGNFISGNQAIQSEVLRIIATAPLSLNLGTSVLTVTGTAYFPTALSYTEAPIADISLSQLTFKGDSSTLRFTAPGVFFRIQAWAGPIQFGKLWFSSAQGEMRFINENRDTLGVRIRHLDLRGDATFAGSFQLDTLSLAPGKNFSFEGGRTYPLRKLFAAGSCPAPIQVFSSKPGLPVVFRAVQDTIRGDFLSLRDVHGTGGAYFEASNSADLGNNNGWTVRPKATNRLYWVGDTGFWGDADNWSLQSGGPGGACVPTAGDDVIFDANSFSTPGGIVVADRDNLYCRSMEWFGATGKPVFKGAADRNLRIFGSLALIPNMTFEFEGDVYFESNMPGNTIESAGHRFAQDATFNGSGSWILNDSFSVLRNVYFQQGRLNTNSQTVSMQRFVSNTNTFREISLEDSHIKLQTPDYQYLVWNIETENCSFKAGTSRIEFLWYGGMEKSGPKGLAYHEVIFRYGASLSIRTPGSPSVEIDSLATYGGAYFTHASENAAGVIKVWQVFRGNVYTIDIKDTLYVDRIVSPPGCQAMVEINSNVDRVSAYLSTPQDLQLERFIIQDVEEVGSGNPALWSSLGIGNIKGWSISEEQGRKLYWVGSSGDWFDTSHWSLSSGGAGGQCVPTPIDDVFFDEKSFSGPNDGVYTGNGAAYCRNMLWQKTTGNPVFSGNTLFLYGSMELDTNLRSDYFTNLILKARGGQHTLKSTPRFEYTYLTLRTPATYTLSSGIKAYRMIFEHGEFHSNGFDVELQYFGAHSWQNFRRLRMGGSHWTLKGFDDGFSGTWSVYSTLEMFPDSSLLEFTSKTARLLVQDSSVFHNVLFSAQEGLSKVQSFRGQLRFNRLEFLNDGMLLGNHLADSLLFSPGKSYQLDAEGVQEVRSFLQVIGNNCLSIALSSTKPGTKSRLRMNSGTISADFIQMRDQQAEGKVAFFAGVHSTNISNSNTGWRFESPEDFVDEGILGKDIVLCKGTTARLDARTFIPGEQYLWSDGSKEPFLNTSVPGTFWAEVRYGSRCTFRDSIQVIAPAEFRAELPADTILCAGDTLRLDAALPLLGIRYLWQDSTRKSGLTVRNPGKYRVELELSGCTSADSLQVSYQALPLVGLGPDRSLCPAEVLRLGSGNAAAASYRWQDGSRDSTVLVSRAGTYAVEVSDGRCRARDTVEIRYESPMNLRLGADTTICEGALVTWAPLVPGAAFRWQDGSTKPTFSAIDSGTYWVEASRNNCTERDSVALSVQVLPRFELGADTTLCQGQSLVLQGPIIPGVTYAWNTGAAGQRIEVSSSAGYALTATLKGCTFSDARQVTFNALPEISLGPDLSPCPGEEVLMTPYSPGAVLKWQDGSTGPTFRIRQDGLYWAEATRSGCSRRDSVRAVYRLAPVVALGADTTLCAGQALLLQSPFPGATYRWSSGSNAVSETVRQAGTYWLESELNGCKVRDSIRVAFFAFPADWLGPDRALCAGQTLRLSASTPGASYRWQDGSTSPVFTVDRAGSYTVEVKVGLCVQRDTVRMTYNPLPVFSLGRDTTLCGNASFSLLAPEEADAYRWSTGASSRRVSVSQSGLVWAEATLSGCSWRDSITIRFQPVPRPSLGPDTTICAKDQLLLKSNIQAERYEWQDGSTGPQLAVKQAGTYILTTSDGLCRGSDTIVVRTRECTVFSLFAPNAFSPNDDGVNDAFIPQLPPDVEVLRYELRLFDRWGNLVFQSQTPGQGWDGTYRGTKLPQGVFLYTLSIQARDDVQEIQDTFSGDVLLLR